jgi:RNA polymerase sigma-70 factor (ECF subfamily)
MRAEIQSAIDLLHSDSSDAVTRSLSILQRAIYDLSMRFCRRREDAEDTSQEVLLRIAALLPHFTKPEALALWLYKVARSRCLNSRRRSKFAPAQVLSLEETVPGPKELDGFDHKSITPESLLLEAEKVEGVLEAVRRLPARQRIVLVLHDMEGLQSTEIADILQLDERAVRVRLHRARLFVRNELAVSASRLPSRPISISSRDRGCEELIQALSEYPDPAAARSICRQLENHIMHCRPCQTLLEHLETGKCPTCPPSKATAQNTSGRSVKFSKTVPLTRKR